MSRLWRTKEGVVMRIVDMTDSHLKNAITYTEHRIAAFRVSGLPTPHSVRSLRFLIAERDRRAGTPTPPATAPGRRKIRFD